MKQSTTIPINKTFMLKNGQKIGYKIHEGDKTPIVLIHGAGSSMKVWDFIVEKLTEENRCVVTIDLPGHGSSCARSGQYRPEESVKAISEVLEYENITKTHLVGHSLGGALVVGLAELLPENTESVTLVAPGGLGRSVSLPLRAATLPGADKVLSVAFSRTVVSTFSDIIGTLENRGLPLMVKQEDIEALTWLSIPERRKAFLATLKNVVGPTGQKMSTITRLIKQDSSKYLVIWGSSDPVLPVRQAQTARKVLPNAELKIFTNLGHEPFNDNPNLFVQTLLNHINRWDRQGLT